MCLCRNSCLPKGLANWILIYNLPLEAKLEGDSSCLQLPVAQEANPLLPWSCPQWGSPAQATASSPGGLSFLAYAATVRKLNIAWERGWPRSSFSAVGLFLHGRVSNSAVCWDSNHGICVAAPKPDPLGTVVHGCHYHHEELYVCVALCPCCGYERN